MAFDPDLDDAVVIALRDMIKLICARTGISREDAYTLCSLAADLRITQVVNGAKGIHVMLEKTYRTLRCVSAPPALALRPDESRAAASPARRYTRSSSASSAASWRVRPPSRRGDDVAAAPFETLAVDGRRPRAFDDRIDIICRGAIRRGGDARSEPHHRQSNRVHRRIAELDMGAERAGRIGRGGIEAFERFAQRKNEWRILGRRRIGEGLVGASPPPPVRRTSARAIAPAARRGNRANRRWRGCHCHGRGSTSSGVSSTSPGSMASLTPLTSV